MSTATIVIIVIVVLVIAALAVLVLRPQMQRRRLREKFGPEYYRTVETTEDRREAERELAQREQRHSTFDLRPLSASARESYTKEWAGVQEEFVDEPAKAVTDADRLVTTIMAERGYPTEGYDQQLADLSVEHSTTLDHYRSAHDIVVRHGRNEASTEDLRNAMVHYRSLFEDLLNRGSEHSADAEETAAERHVDTDRRDGSEQTAGPDDGVDDNVADDRTEDGRIAGDSAAHGRVLDGQTEPDPQRRV
jgi:hypothetical protein